MLKLVTALAAALAVASSSALAVDLPDYGSKNFDPSGDTPTYFANEAVPVAARTADTTERDWSVVDAVAPERPRVEPSASTRTKTGRHGRYAWGHRAGEGSFGRGHSTHFTAAGQAEQTRTGAAHSSSARARTALWGAGSRGAPAARTTTVKHGKPSAWNFAAPPRAASSLS